MSEYNNNINWYKGIDKKQVLSFVASLVLVTGLMVYFALPLLATIGVILGVFLLFTLGRYFQPSVVSQMRILDVSRLRKKVSALEEMDIEKLENLDRDELKSALKSWEQEELEILFDVCFRYEFNTLIFLAYKYSDFQGVHDSFIDIIQYEQLGMSMYNFLNKRGLVDDPKIMDAVWNRYIERLDPIALTATLSKLGKDGLSYSAIRDVYSNITRISPHDLNRLQPYIEISLRQHPNHFAEILKDYSGVVGFLTNSQEYDKYSGYVSDEDDDGLNQNGLLNKHIAFGDVLIKVAKNLDQHHRDPVQTLAANMSIFSQSSQNILKEGQQCVVIHSPLKV